MTLTQALCKKLCDSVVQDLRSTVQQLRSELQVKEAQLKESECDKHSEVTARDKTISQLQLSLREKEKLLQVRPQHL